MVEWFCWYDWKLNGILHWNVQFTFCVFLSFPWAIVHSREDYFKKDKTENTNILRLLLIGDILFWCNAKTLVECAKRWLKCTWKAFKRSRNNTRTVFDLVCNLNRPFSVIFCFLTKTATKSLQILIFCNARVPGFPVQKPRDLDRGTVIYVRFRSKAVSKLNQNFGKFMPINIFSYSLPISLHKMAKY